MRADINEKPPHINPGYAPEYHSFSGTVSPFSFYKIYIIFAASNSVKQLLISEDEVA